LAMGRGPIRNRAAPLLHTYRDKFLLLHFCLGEYYLFHHLAT